MLSAAAYLVVMGLWIYVVLERDYFSSDPAAASLVLAAIAGVQVAAGLLVGRWWALTLPVLVVLLSVPAGYPDVTSGEPLPIWLGLALFSPVALLLLAIGVAAARRFRAPGSG